MSGAADECAARDAPRDEMHAGGAGADGEDEYALSCVIGRVAIRGVFCKTRSGKVSTMMRMGDGPYNTAFPILRVLVHSIVLMNVLLERRVFMS